MSRYGSVNITGPTSLITRIVESADPDDLATEANAAIAALPGGYVVVGITVAGAGDGATFTVTIEAGAAADAVGGFTSTPAVTCFLGSDAEVLAALRAVAGPSSGTFADTQMVGASNGTRFMGLVVQGDLPAGGGVTAADVSYVDTAPLLGSTNVQGAIDALKRIRLVFSGSTSGLNPGNTTEVGPFTLLSGEVPMLLVGDVIDNASDIDTTWTEGHYTVSQPTISWVYRRAIGDPTGTVRIVFLNGGATSTIQWRWALFAVRWFG